MRRPRVIAEQARHARGALGRVISFIMARETWRDNLTAMDALYIQPRDHVLDVGCGHGRSLGELAARASSGRVTGIDPSQTMIDISARRNGALVRARRVDLAIASADKTYLDDASVDKILCVHVAYFWPSLSAACVELARVTKQGGRLAMVLRTAANAAAVRAFPDDVYAFPTMDEVMAALGQAGFVVLMEESNWRDESHAPVLLVAERAGR